MKKPRTCLVNPPHPYLMQPKAQAPLGLLYVASALKDRQYPVEFVDLSDRHYQDCFELPEAEIYGITGTVLDRRAVEAVAKQIRATNPKAKIVIGGPITLSLDKLDSRLFDTAVFGEGERVILRIVKDYPNLLMRYRADRIDELDTLRWPARGMLGECLGGGVFANKEHYFEGGSTVFVTSRGCPFDCVFCASPRLWGRKIVYRDPSSVCLEIKNVVDRFGVRQFRFSDDNVTANPNRVEAICKLLAPMRIAWRASIRVRPHDIRMFEAMKRGGCVEVCFGVESGDDHVLRVLRKKATVEDNRTAILNAKKAGLVVRVLFMTGTPGERPDTTKRNIDFLESVKDHYDTIALTNFVPLPGTPVAEDPHRHGVEILDDDIDKFNLCMYGPEGENNWPNLVRPYDMTLDQLTVSKDAMRIYVKSVGKSNQG